MDRLASDHAGDVAFFGEDLDAGAGERERVDAADGPEGNQALRHDADDLESDLVVVAGQHELELRVGIEARDGVAEHVRADVVRERPEVVAVDFRLFELEPGGSAGHQEFFEKLFRFCIDHDVISKNEGVDVSDSGRGQSPDFAEATFSGTPSSLYSRASPSGLPSRKKQSLAIMPFSW